MPVIVHEIVIRAVVETEDRGDKKGESAAVSNIDILVSECVEQVLDILALKKER